MHPAYRQNIGAAAVEWVYFFGRFHVLVLHLPIGIIYVTVILELLARRPRFAGLAAAANYLWAAAAISATLTVALGLAHSTEGGFTGESLVRHRALGILVAVLATGLFIFRVKGPRAYHRSQVFTGLFALVLVAVTGHYGGNMTHGSTYMTEYAPAFLKRLVGISVGRDKPVDVANADIFADVIHPLLALRCGSCHGESTRKGKLSFATYDLLMKGGEDFPAVVPGDLLQSEMYARVTMPQDSPDFMPKEHKTPLTPDQVKILGWWIQAGAPGKGTVSSMKPPDDVLKVLGQQLSASTPHG
jgi:uncharacterized membrane protein